jgi:hypothetical protein
MGMLKKYDKSTFILGSRLCQTSLTLGNAMPDYVDAGVPQVPTLFCEPADRSIGISEQGSQRAIVASFDPPGARRIPSASCNRVHGFSAAHQSEDAFATAVQTMDNIFWSYPDRRAKMGGLRIAVPFRHVWKGADKPIRVM